MGLNLRTEEWVGGSQGQGSGSAKGGQCSRQTEDAACSDTQESDSGALGAPEKYILTGVLSSKEWIWWR